MYKTAIGQDSHRFESADSAKPLFLGGAMIPCSPGLEGNSDADVVLHAITNAVSGISGVNILGQISDDLCLKQGIKDSSIYLKRALETLNGYSITHCSISIECKTPKIAPHVETIKASVAKLLSLNMSDIGLTATTGEGLTDFGLGKGIQVFVIITAQQIKT